VRRPRFLIVTFLVASIGFGQNSDKSPAHETADASEPHFSLESYVVASAQEPMGVGGLDSLLVPIQPRQINAIHPIPLSRNLDSYLPYIAPTENVEDHPAPPSKQAH
jgi:hypothetical protein